MIEVLLVTLHVIVSLFLIFVVLLQSGTAADLAGAFGGGGSQTALGMRGAATLLQKLTTAAAVIFMLTSLSLGIVGRQDRSVLEGVEQSAPAQPGTEQGEGQTEAGQGQGDQGQGQQEQGGQAAPIL